MAGKPLHGGTTVSGTMVLAHLAGIKIFGTGGLGAYACTSHSPSLVDHIQVECIVEEKRRWIYQVRNKRRGDISYSDPATYLYMQ